MANRINLKEADSIIKALEAGVVPQRGIGHLLVGRSREVDEVISILDKLSQGDSDLRIWVGDFGSGKSFMLRTIESIALAKNFVVSTLDLTPSRRFYASDGKARALYSELIDSLKTRTSQDGNALESIIQEWLNSLISQLSAEKNLGLEELMTKDYIPLISSKILDVTSSFSSTGLSYEMGQALTRYLEGMVDDKREFRLNALRWLRGDIGTKTEAKNVLAINKIINDDNYYEALKNLSELFHSIGYSGFVINFDEIVNLYKLPMAKTRERNYERILNFYNELKSGKAKALFVNLGGTRKSVFDENRGMASYGALKTRLGDERAMDSKLINTNRTVLPLKPLSLEEIFTLLEKILEVYQVYHKADIPMTMDEIGYYMEEQLNRPGADEFLTPRAVIKDFLEILDLIRQNPEVSTLEIIGEKFGILGRVYKDQDDHDDEIEVF